MRNSFRVTNARKRNLVIQTLENSDHEGVVSADDLLKECGTIEVNYKVETHLNLIVGL